MDSAPVSSPQTFTASSCMRGQVPQGTRLRKWRCGSEMALQLALVFPLMSSRALQTWKPLLVSEFVCVGAKFQQSHGNFHSFWLIPTNSYQFRLICRNTPMHFHKIQLVCRPISLDLFKVQQSRWYSVCPPPNGVACLVCFEWTSGIARPWWPDELFFSHIKQIVPGQAWIPHRSSGRLNTAEYWGFSKRVDWD